MDTAYVIIIIAVLVGIIIARYVVITVRMKRSPLGHAIALFREVKHNRNVIRRIGYAQRLTLFMTGVWEVQKNDIKFLPEDLRKRLAALYENIYRINDEVQSSVEGKRESHLMSVNTDSVAEPLQQITRELDDWITRNVNNPDYAPKRLGFFGF